MTRPFTLAPAVVAACVLSTAPVGAVPIIATYETSAGYLGSAVLEEDDSASVPELLSARVAPEIWQLQEAAPPPVGAGFAEAVLLRPGVTYAEVSGTLNDSIHDGLHVLSARVSSSQTHVIPGLAGRYKVLFSYLLDNPVVEIWDDAGLSGADGQWIDALFGYTVRLNGEVVIDIGAHVRGTRDAPTLWLVRPDGSLYELSDSSTGPGDVPRRVEFGRLAATDRNLGFVEGDGDEVLDTFEIDIDMTAALVIPSGALSAGGRVSVGDPNGVGLDAMGALSVVPAAPVPLPATGGMALGAVAVLGGLRGLRRRASKRS